MKNILSQEQALLAKLERFNNTLQKNPPPKILDKGRKALSLPISYVERELDKIFGVWEHVNFSTMRVGNEMVASLELRVYHPVLKEFITRTGTAAKMILQAKDTPFDQIERYKYANALETAFPALKNMALKNAAKSLGKRFGRDLNREDNKTAPVEDRGSYEKVLIKGCLDICKESKTPQELKENYLDEFAIFASTTEIFTASKNLLKATNKIGLDGVLESGRGWKHNNHILEIYNHIIERNQWS